MSETNELDSLRLREAQLEAELERRLTPSERQARELRAATVRVTPDTRTPEQMTASERQAAALRRVDLTEPRPPRAPLRCRPRNPGPESATAPLPVEGSGAIGMLHDMVLQCPHRWSLRETRWRAEHSGFC